MVSIKQISSGIKGLDEILHGGFISKRAYLLQGGPGTGKSTIAYEFVSQASSEGSVGLYITLGERKKNILQNAAQVGIDLSGVNFLDLAPEGSELFEGTNSYNVFPVSDVQEKPILEQIVAAIEVYEPQRVVLDSVTMLEFLHRDPFQRRSLGLMLSHYICRQGATMLMLSETMADTNRDDDRYWADGIIQLLYTPAWRKISVKKYRGSSFEPGNHAFKITDKGVDVYPQLKPGGYKRSFISKSISSGINDLDNLLLGGIEKGTITMLTGPSGVGKTNLGMQFLKEAASRGERSVIYTFEESEEIIKKRSESINVPIKRMIENGNLKIISIEPFSYSPDEFTAMVRRDIEENDTRFVMIDSMGGYSLAVREENALERLHALTVYLQNMGVTGFLINETRSVTGTLETTNMHASYLADNIIFLRYVEMKGELRKVIGVLKKRLSDFEQSMREFEITSDGIKVGNKLGNFRGILTGRPEPVDFN